MNRDQQDQVTNMQIQIETTIRFIGRRPQTAKHPFELKATFSCPHDVAKQLREDARRLAVDCPIMDDPAAMLAWWVEKLRSLAVPAYFISLLQVEIPDGSTTYSWHAE